MVGYDAHRYATSLALRLVGNIYVVVGYNFLARRQRRHAGKKRREQIRVVIRPFPLQHRHQPLQSQSRIHMPGRKRFERPIAQSIVLDEHKVPQFHDLRVIGVDQLLAGHGPTRLVRAQIDMDFRAAPARPLVAHHPEVIFRVSIEDVIRIDARFRFPQSGRLRIGRQTQCIVALVHGSVQPVRSQPEYVHEQLPGPPDGFLLEIIPERPVAQHLEERMMVRIETDLFEIVVLSGYPETFLGVHGPAVVPLACSKKNILELVHPGIREEQCGIAMRRQRIARHYLMPSIPEKI